MMAKSGTLNFGKRSEDAEVGGHLNSKFTDSLITNIGFRDVDYHSGEPYDGTDWTAEVNNLAGLLSWSTDTYAADPNANALRWSTMYNFRFDADSPPQPTTAQIGLFRDGGPSSVSVMVLAPAVDTSTIFIDGFESGNTGAWSGGAP